MVTLYDINGKRRLVRDAKRVKAMLASGKFTKSPPQKEDSFDFLSEADADTNKSGKLSTDEIRQAAKNAGIENWATARPARLREKLWPTTT